MSNNTLEFIDTHCHIHDSEFAKKFDKSVTDVMNDARDDGVRTFVCVGTDLESSRQAVAFARSHKSCFASLALHPHEVAACSDTELESVLKEFDSILYEDTEKIVAIGECGLDYFYHQDELVRTRQKALLRDHLVLAKKYQLPLIFHIRDAFDDFFDVFDEFKGLRGVVHSFSAGPAQLEAALDRGLYIGLNGIMTFSKQAMQLEAARMVPLEKMVLETDAPFLTPAPFRGTMCEPKHLRVTAAFLSELRSESIESIAQATTANAKQLFGI